MRLNLFFIDIFGTLSAFGITASERDVYIKNDLGAITRITIGAYSV